MPDKCKETPRGAKNYSLELEFYGIIECLRSKFISIFHRPNEDFNLQRFFMKMKIEDEKPLFFSSSKI